MHAPLFRFVEPTYAIMRGVVGFLFALHGAQKLFGVLDGTARPIGSLMGLAGIIEFTAGLFVMIGLVAGMAAFIASGQMAFAYFLTHASRGAWPIQNGGELAVLFCFLFLFISARGAGTWSVDAMMFRHRSPMPAASGAEGWTRG